MKPDSQGAGDLEPVHGLAVLGAELMGSLVTFDTQGMKELAHHRLKTQLTVKAVKKISLGRLLIELDPGTRC